MIKAAVKTKTNTGAQKKLRRLNQSIILKAGFLAPAASYPDGAKVAHVAQYMEFGTNTIPARPFFRTAITRNKKKWRARLYKDIQKDYNTLTAFKRLGVLIQADIRDSIKNGAYTPLKPYTIRRKGFDKPLIDTGIMLRSVDWEVRRQ